MFSFTIGGVVHCDGHCVGHCVGTSSPYSAQIFLYTYVSHFVVTLQVCRTYILHPAVMCYTVSWASCTVCTWGPVRFDPGLIDLVLGLFMCCHDQCICVVPKTSLPSHWYVFSISATSSICWCYILSRGLFLHDGLPSSSFSSLGGCCQRHSLCRSSLGFVFLMYSWILLLSSWISSWF